MADCFGFLCVFVSLCERFSLLLQREFGEKEILKLTFDFDSSCLLASGLVSLCVFVSLCELIFACG